jgi:hypothetical protein
LEKLDRGAIVTIFERLDCNLQARFWVLHYVLLEDASHEVAGYWQG